MLECSIGLGSQHEETFHLVQQIQALEIKIGAVHYVKCVGFRSQPVQNIDIVHFAIGNMD